MNIATKALISLAVMGGCFAAGYLTRVPAAPKTITKIEVVEKEKIVTKVVTVTETRPDGSTTTTETAQTTSDSQTVTESKQAEKPVPAVSPTLHLRYSIGVQWTPRLNEDFYKPTGVELGYRALGNLWTTAGYDWRDKSVTLGVRVEF